MAQRRRCKGTVGNPASQRFGAQCGAWAMPGLDYCNMHRAKAPELLANRCVRRKKDGEQCRNPAVRGSTVCMKHGINRFALAKAQQRLASFADPALTVLYDLMIKPSTSDSDRGRYALAIIDRVGLSPNARIEVGVEMKPWEITMQHILRELPEDYMPAIAGAPGGAIDDTVIDAEVVDEPVNSRDALTRIIPPHSPTERATYVRPQRTAEPPAHLV